MSARQIAGACVVGAYLLAVGFLGGTIAGTMRFDAKRSAILAELEDASSRARAKLMLLEHDAARTAAVR